MWGTTERFVIAPIQKHSVNSDSKRCLITLLSYTTASVLRFTNAILLILFVLATLLKARVGVWVYFCATHCVQTSIASVCFWLHAIVFVTLYSSHKTNLIRIVGAPDANKNIAYNKSDSNDSILSLSLRCFVLLVLVYFSSDACSIAFVDLPYNGTWVCT